MFPRLRGKTDQMGVVVVSGFVYQTYKIFLF